MPDLTHLFFFAAALFVAAAMPGPGIAAIVARVLSRGPHGAAAFSAGVAAGDVVWLSFAVAGLVVLAQTFSGLFFVIKYGGAAYLLYLAWKLWTTPVVTGQAAELTAESTPKLFLAGLSVTLGNPKVMVFYTALLPALIDLPRLTLPGYITVAAVTLAVLAVVFGGYIALASRARRLFTSRRSLQLINRGSGVVIAGAAAAIALRA